MSQFVEIHSDSVCPNCGHNELRSKDCDNLFCENGGIDEYEYDAINFAPGEVVIVCEECKGTEVIIWCPKCLGNFSGQDVIKEDNYFQQPSEETGGL